MPADPTTLWSPVPVEVWAEALEHLPRPLTTAQAKADLAHLVALHRFRGAKKPTARTCAERWGWSKTTAHRFLKSEDPCGTKVGQKWDTGGTEVGLHEKEECQESKDSGTEVGQKWDTGGTEVDTRALGKDKKKKREENTYGVLLAHLVHYRPSAKVFESTSGNGKWLATMLKKVGLDESRRLITAAYEHPRLAWMLTDRSGKAQHPSIAALGRDPKRYLEDIDGAPPTTTKPPPKGQRSFLDMLEELDEEDP